MSRTNPSPFTTWENWYNIEWRVNAVWTTLLSNAFTPANTPGSYILMSEVYPPGNSNSKRAMDLAVARISQTGATWSTTPPKVVFEGKGLSAKKSFETVEAQCARWCEYTDSVPGGYTCWVVIGNGDESQFYRWADGQLDLLDWDRVERSFSVKVNKAKRRVDDERNVLTRFTMRDHYVEITDALAFMVGNNPP